MSPVAAEISVATKRLKDDSAPKTLKKGDEIDVFFRFEKVLDRDFDEPLFPVWSTNAALQYPRIGMTDGWIPAIVERDFPCEKSSSSSNGNDKDGKDKDGKDNDLVKIKLCHRMWGNRKGDLHFNGDDELRPFKYARIEDVRQRGMSPPPKVSIICLRWGVWSPYHDKDGAWGGWGPFGTCVCDKYIKGFFQCMYDRVGPRYEVISCFVHSSADLRRLSATSLVPQLSSLRSPGGVTAAMYFLWPVAWLDGHAGDLSADDLAGYVENDALLQTMASFEAAGVPTRHPHPSHLYRLLCSKMWSAHMCLSPGFHVPATTRINRATGLNDPAAAAKTAVAALRQMVNQQQLIASKDTSKVGEADTKPFRGVAKLGFAWEAREVYHFKGEEQLAHRLKLLLHQDGSTAEAVFVQRFVPHNCEIRVYCLHGKPERLLYTCFSKVGDDGAPSGFRALERNNAVEEWFDGDQTGLTKAEDLILHTLVPRWICWLRTESCEVPSAIRMDFFVNVTTGGAAEVTIGELTEQGASTLGWEDGATRTFHAIIDSCLGTATYDPEADASEAKSPKKRKKQNGSKAAD